MFHQELPALVDWRELPELRTYTPEEIRRFRALERQRDQDSEHYLWTGEEIRREYDPALLAEYDEWAKQRSFVPWTKEPVHPEVRARYAVDAILMFPSERPEEIPAEFVFFRGGKWRGNDADSLEAVLAVADAGAARVGYVHGQSADHWEEWIQALAEALGATALYVRPERQLRNRLAKLAQFRAESAAGESEPETEAGEGTSEAPPQASVDEV